MRRLLAAALSALIVLSVPVLIASVASAERRFSVLCETGELSDPGKDPFLAATTGVRFNDHAHQFFGSEGIRDWPQRSTLKHMRNSGTTCEFSGDTATYWMPLFMEADGDVVGPTQALVYYRGERGEHTVPHAPGDVFKSSDVQWGCKDSDQFARPPDCGKQDIRLRVIFRPEKVSGGQTPRIAMNVRYDTTDGSGGHLMGGSSGEHGNFWNTWKQKEYRRLIDLCLNKEADPDRCFKVSD